MLFSVLFTARSRIVEETRTWNRHDNVHCIVCCCWFTVGCLLFLVCFCLFLLFFFFFFFFFAFFFAVLCCVLLLYNRESVSLGKGGRGFFLVLSGCFRGHSCLLLVLSRGRRLLRHLRRRPGGGGRLHTEGLHVAATRGRARRGVPGLVTGSLDLLLHLLLRELLRVGEGGALLLLARPVLLAPVRALLHRLQHLHDQVVLVHLVGGLLDGGSHLLLLLLHLLAVVDDDEAVRLQLLARLLDLNLVLLHVLRRLALAQRLRGRRRLAHDVLTRLHRVEDLAAVLLRPRGLVLRRHLGLVPLLLVRLGDRLLRARLLRLRLHLRGRLQHGGNLRLGALQLREHDDRHNDQHNKDNNNLHLARFNITNEVQIL
eukprot:Rhum_TRINITY_DN15478_c3_g2::Rhum_TRINITY_DN15478_c3_g2_i1::g.160534::m.160534